MTTKNSDNQENDQLAEVPAWVGEGVGDIDYFEDSAPGSIAEASIERLVRLAKQSVALAKEVDELTVQLAEKQEELKSVNRVSIPELMQELGLANFKLEDGSLVDVKDKVAASISEANKPAAFQWLADNDFDGIIKSKVVAQFGRGEAAEAQKAIDALRDLGYMAAKDESVHYQTLQSFVKERLAEGDVLPDSFSVHEFKEATIKLPKKKK